MDGSSLLMTDSFLFHFFSPMTLDACAWCVLPLVSVILIGVRCVCCLNDVFLFGRRKQLLLVVDVPFLRLLKISLVVFVTHSLRGLPIRLTKIKIVVVCAAPNPVVQIGRSPSVGATCRRIRSDKISSSGANLSRTSSSGGAFRIEAFRCSGRRRCISKTSPAFASVF